MGGEGRGFCHIDFDSADAARRAIELNGSILLGRRIKVDNAAPDRRGGGGGGYGAPGPYGPAPGAPFGGGGFPPPPRGGWAPPPGGPRGPFDTRGLL